MFGAPTLPAIEHGNDPTWSVSTAVTTGGNNAAIGGDDDHSESPRDGAGGGTRDGARACLRDAEMMDGDGSDDDKNDGDSSSSAAGDEATVDDDGRGDALPLPPLPAHPAPSARLSTGGVGSVKAIAAAKRTARPSSSSPTPSVASSSGAASRTAAVSAAVAACVDAACAHRNLLPGLSALFFAPGGVGSTGVEGRMGKSDDDAAANAPAFVDGHPSLPSVDAVANAARRSINDCPPFVHMSSRDSAPQIHIEDPSAKNGAGVSSASNAGNADANVSFDSGGPSGIVVNRRLVVKGGMRGYRMSRATHGATKGWYYYEAVIMEPPSASEVARGIVNSSSTSSSSQRGGWNNQNSGTMVTLGKGLKLALQEGLVQEELGRQGRERREKEGRKKKDEASSPGNAHKKRRTDTSATSSSDQCTNIGHVRMGWSMRTGDLQAPVGYDKWSYAVRDTLGSRIHNSRREDQWGGYGFSGGDVVGFAICLVGNNDGTHGSDSSGAAGKDKTISGGNAAMSSSQNPVKSASSSFAAVTPLSGPTNHIRFFKNGEGMGTFVISQGKRYGGLAFDNISPGTYYPAISCYMGGRARINFGPHFVYNPRGLPPGTGKPQPVSDLCPPPLDADEAVQFVVGGKEGKKLFASKRTDEGVVAAFKELVRTEALMRHDAHSRHTRLHFGEVRVMREERGLSTSDLPAPVAAAVTTPSVVAL